MMGAILFKWVCVSGSGPVPRLWPAQALPPPYPFIRPSIHLSVHGADVDVFKACSRPSHGRGIDEQEPGPSSWCFSRGG